jgi:hypothetical protein
MEGRTDVLSERPENSSREGSSSLVDWFTDYKESGPSSRGFKPRLPYGGSHPACSLYASGTSCR